MATTKGKGNMITVRVEISFWSEHSLDFIFDPDLIFISPVTVWLAMDLWFAHLNKDNARLSLTRLPFHLPCGNVALQHLSHFNYGSMGRRYLAALQRKFHD
jgi:hypothetical protein